MNNLLLNASKEISYALRHNPWLYGLEMDSEGFVPIQQLIDGINTLGEQDFVLSLDDIYTIQKASHAKRWEIRGDTIRALYGHSISIEKMIGHPPSILYHGTSHKSIPSIFEQGLLPMSRQYVHLSVDLEKAMSVGKRKDSNPVILLINTQMAMEHGVHFYVGNEKIWLSESIPPSCLLIQSD